ncbi:hypothetical protein N0V82_002007 [Gnomoniopsis sp. IMI 355080]|nr:hypothetical protein N0V82_002007 [Gnomoniopsis sp. IMI 355080]
MGPAPHNGTRTRQPSSSSYATKPPGSYSWPSPPVTLHTGGTSSSLPKPSSSVPYSNITSGTARESTTVVVSPYPSIIHSTTSLPVANSSRTIPHFHTTITETVDTTVISTHTYTPGDSASTIPDLHTTITETVDTTVISTHTYTPSASASSARDFTSVLPTDVTSHATSVTPSSSASSSETTSSDSYSSSKLPLAFSSRPSSSHSSTYTPSFFTSVKPSTSSSSTAYTPPSHGLGSSGGEGGDSYSGGDSSGSKLHQDGHSRGGKGQQRDDEDEYSHSWSYGSRHRAKKIGEK